MMLCHDVITSSIVATHLAIFRMIHELWSFSIIHKPFTIYLQAYHNILNLAYVIQNYIYCRPYDKDLESLYHRLLLRLSTPQVTLWMG